MRPTTSPERRTGSAGDTRASRLRRARRRNVTSLRHREESSPMRFITDTRASSGRWRQSVAAAAALIVILAGSTPVAAQESGRSAAADWPTYNRDLAGTRYSPLDQIDTSNVASLEEVWSYRFHPDDGFIEGPSPAELFQQVTPIVVDGVIVPGFRKPRGGPAARDRRGDLAPRAERRVGVLPRRRLRTGHRRPRGPHLLHQPAESHRPEGGDRRARSRVRRRGRGGSAHPLHRRAGGLRRHPDPGL